MPGIYSTARTNRPTCGGSKKAGLPPSVGSMVLNTFSPAMRRTVHNAGGKCDAPYVSKHSQLAGGVGRMFSYKQ